MYLPRECVLLVYCRCHAYEWHLWGGVERGEAGGQKEKGGKQRGGSPAPCNDFGLSDGLRSELNVEVIHECLELPRRGCVLLHHALEQESKGARGC